ncbi:MAG: Rho termination factor N-terminal domain-containing protein [Sphingobacteriales bacterium]|nr:Rho termination factor N-terminal domain-containing protein [Sphingobacteriales bacterium]
MYNLSQLNDMLVLELNDIADQFNISNSKDLSRTDLIAAIMEKQPGSQEVKNDADGADKPKRKRIVKEPVKKEQRLILLLYLPKNP